MVNKPGLEPEPGPGLWQALNWGLAQDFGPEPGPIHHYLGLGSGIWQWDCSKILNVIKRRVSLPHWFAENYPDFGVLGS